MSDQVTRSDWDQWWRHAVIYQVYPRSFNDANGDGVGDIRGIIERLDYLKSLSIDAIWISPHYPSPQADTGYDVADYHDVNPEYGTLEDFDELVAGAHERGMRVLIDLVPNHSSDQHEWFQAALAAGHGSPERDRYMFRYSEGEPPNNWGAAFGGSAWSPVEPLSGKAEDRDWWYLHMFAPEQPDFNWENPEVHEFFRGYLRFWLDRGVDGFRVDVAHGLVKAEGLPDDNRGPDKWAADADAQIDHGPAWDQDGVHEIYREWREVLNEYGRDRILVAEAWVYDPSRLADYVREEEMSQAFNFEYLEAGWLPGRVREVIDSTMGANARVGAPVTWVLSNHDVVRHPSRFGFEPGYSTKSGIGFDDPQPDLELGMQRGKAMTLFTFGLPGSAYLYQGEELGLPEVTDLPDEARQDPTWLRTNHTVRGRDGARVPLPWRNDPKDTGFGQNPWLPQPQDWASYSAEVQENDPDSFLAFYRDMIRLRGSLGLGSGSLEWLEGASDEVLVARNGQTVLVINMSGEVAELAGVGSVLIAAGEVTESGGVVTVPANAAAWLG
ncbi:MAG: glycoside hydrolase family 13 protein [Actinomycetaceae bacterium]|nr:glycoside hydrolase family 13 protein [Actinomycetaceae bacterium]